MSDARYFFTTFFGMIGVIGFAFALVCFAVHIYCELREWFAQKRERKEGKGSTGASPLA